MECQEKIVASIDAALSNFVILKQIFSNLLYTDLVSCCKVNKTWLSVLDPLMCYCGITVKCGRATRSNSRANAIVEVEEIHGFDGLSENSRTNMEGLIENLRNLKKHHLISIELRLSLGREKLNFDRDLYLTFLLEFGHRVHIMDYQSNPYPFDFREYLLHLSYLSNLEVLKLNRLSIFSSTPQTVGDDWTSSGITVFPQLRKIYFGDSVSLLHMNYLLGAASNVKEIVEVPLKAYDIVSRFGKIDAVKSIIYSTSYPEELHRADDSTEHLLERFSNLGVRLTAAAVPNIHHIVGQSAWDPTSNCAKEMKKYTHRILESSKDTAKILIIPASKALDFYFPIDFQMKSVKILQFEDDSHGLEYKQVCWNKKEVQRGDLSLQESEYHYFPKGTNVKSLFPTLEGLEIKFELLKRDLIKFFPLDVFGPAIFGSNLKKLKIHGTSPDCFQHLVTLFPYITHLEMESTLTHFNIVFPIIAKSWSLLENLVVFIDSAKGFHCDSKGCNLDSVLVGIPENVCSELNRGRKSRKKISIQEITKLQEAESSLLNLEKLTQLQFVVEGLDFFCGLCYKNHVPNFITGVTVEYALKQLPGLEVTVRMSKGLNAFDELRTALEPTADYIHVDNTFVPPELSFL